MRWLVLSLLLPCVAQAASVLLVPEDDKARVLAADLVDGFSAAKLTVKTAPPGSPAVACLKATDRNACLSAIGEKAKTLGVFVVSGGLKGAKGTLTLELIIDGASKKKDTTRVMKGKVKPAMKGVVAAMIKLLPAADAPAPAPEPAKVTVSETPKPEPKPEPVVTPTPVRDDTPRKADLTPPPARNDDLDLRSAPPKSTRPKVAAWVVTGLTVVAAGVSATTAGLGASHKGQLDTVNGGVSSLSYQQAVALQQQANSEFTVSLATGIGAGVGAVVSGILWGVE